MIQDAFWGLLIPFLGTSLGAGCVFFLKNSLRDGIQRALTGFAAGVMVAASVWSLLIPAMEQAADLGRLAFFPAAVGFWLGILFLLLLDHLIPHLHQNSLQAEGPKSQLQRTTMMVLAVTLHNIPEGMAVGVVYAGYLAGTAQITAAGALALSLGIAIQNFPEGAIISMPLRAEGMKKGRAFWGGVLSGIVEPIGAVLTILAAGIVVPALPYLLSFAAGAMLYVVVEELIPEMSQGQHSNVGTVFFTVGFSVMMVLDCGCGGGANIKTLLKLCPNGKVQGIDYSAVSVEKARKVNARAIAAGRCTVQQASVAELPFEAEQFDAVTAFETVYFWPELAQNFREVYRVLKPGGIFFICNEANGETTKDDKWTQIIDGMTIYTDTALKEYLEKAGFCQIQSHKNKKGWLCVTAQKR